MSFLRFKQVEKRFGAKQVILPLDLELADGAFVALLGPSGCGKTTLLRMVAGLEDPSGGEIWIGDRAVYAHGESTPPEERGLGMVFQSYAVWPHMTVSENVAYPLKLARRRVEPAERERRVGEALELVHMRELGDRYPHQLSGGQQRGAGARAGDEAPDFAAR
jgi:ABC-type Fe3+/spermidine/putrescine transport system ATPase subunit